MRRLIWFMLYLPIQAQAQNKGIHFEQGVTWEQVRAKAKTENKYIFVDCYATWCGPCKYMDKSVYPNDTVGNYMNAQFVSVKVQMDTSKRELDNEEIKKWYASAQVIQQEYKVFAFPTYLFFSPDGRMVHKDLGAKNVNDFVVLAKDAVTPGKQYVALLEDYEHGQKDYAVMPYLAKIAKNFNDNDLALQIAADYMHGYLDNLSENGFSSKENLGFIRTYLKIVSSKDRIFNLYFNQAEKVDSILGTKGYAQHCVDNIITKEEIDPFIAMAKNDGPDPNWGKITKAIKSKYGAQYATRNVLNAKPGFYKYKKDWKNYTKYLVKLIEKLGIDNVSPGMFGAMYLNNNAWDVFQYSNNKKELRKAFSWSERAVRIDSSYLAVSNMDTKANILYKLGHKSDAIVLEEQIVALSPQEKIFQETLEKMRKGMRTW